MSENRPKNGETASVLGALPSSRPHRRSEKRKTAIAATPEVEAASKAAAPPKAAAAPKAAGAAPKRSAAGAKRTAAGPKAAGPGSRPLRQPPQPRGLPRRPDTAKPAPARPESAQRSAPTERPAPPRRELLATAVRAAAELTEMGLSAGARALREAVSRLPRP